MDFVKQKDLQTVIMPPYNRELTELNQVQYGLISTWELADRKSWVLPAKSNGLTSTGCCGCCRLESYDFSEVAPPPTSHEKWI